MFTGEKFSQKSFTYILHVLKVWSRISFVLDWQYYSSGQISKGLKILISILILLLSIPILNQSDILTNILERKYYLLFYETKYEPTNIFCYC